MSYEVTKSRILQWLGIILIIGVFSSVYWYVEARAGFKTNGGQTGMLTSGLIGMWSFDGTDVSGTTVTDRGTGGNNATLTSGVSVVPGKIGQALRCSGVTNEFASTADPISTGVLTISFWVKLATTSGSEELINQDNAAGFFWSVKKNVGGTIKWQINTGSFPSVDSKQTLNEGTWYHIVVISDDTNLSIYINGVLDNSAAGGIRLNPTGSFQICARGTFGGGINSTVTLDEIRIYSRTLTSGEIESLYNQGGGTKVNSAVSQAQGTGRLDSGLAGYWKMDDGAGTSATDSSTNGNTGTLTNGPTWTTGQIGGAVDFDGTDDYVTVADSDAIDIVDSRNFTLSGWFNRDTFTTDDTIIAKSNGQTAADTGYTLYVDDATDKITFVANDGTDQYKLESVSTFTATGWNQYAVVWDDTSSGQTKLYVNGVAEAATATGTFANVNSLANAVTYRIGAESDSGNPFDGKIDEARLYDRVLSSDEVSQLYRLTTPTGVDTGLKGYWSFNGKTVSGTTASDQSGAGNAGMLTNGPVVTPGKIGQALDFDGTDDYVTVADNASLDFGDSADLSLSGWFYRDSFTTDDTIIAKRNGIVSTDTGYLAYIDDATDQFIFEVSDGTDEYSLTSTSTFTTAGWYHYAIVWDQDSATNSEIYINGIADRATDTGTIANIGDLSNALTLRVGTESDSGNPFDGKVDEVRVYSRTLTSGETQSLYDNGQSDEVNTGASQAQGGSRLDSGLTRYWKMDDGTGTSATDSSTNGSAGTLTNGPTWTTGQIGGAVDLDGTDDYVDIGTATTYVSTTAPFSVALWLNPDVFIGANNIPFTLKTNSTTGWTSTMFNDVSYRDFTFGKDNASSMKFSFPGGVTTGNWYHVVITYNGNGFNTATNYTASVNGSSVPVTTLGSLTPIDNESYIGRLKANNGVNNYYWNGKLDDFRLYNRQLSSDEISQLYRLTAPTGTDTDLKGYWSFNGKSVSGTTAYDRSGAGNNGTLTNGPTVTPGKIGQALSFDGSNDYVDAGSASMLDNLSSMTAVAWIKQSSAATFAPVISKSFGVAPQVGGWELLTDASGAGVRTLGFKVDYATTGLTVMSNVGAYSLGEWTQVAVTWDGSTNASNVHLYINGVEVSYFTQTSGSGVYSSDAALSLKIGGVGGGPYFPGLIDEARVYNRVLTAAEIYALYNAGK